MEYRAYAGGLERRCRRSSSRPAFSPSRTEPTAAARCGFPRRAAASSASNPPEAACRAHRSRLSRASRPPVRSAGSVPDAAHFLDVLAGYEPGDPWWAPPPERPFAEAMREPPGTLRIAVTSVPRWIRRSTRSVWLRCLGYGLLEELGHSVAEATPAWREPDLERTFIAVWQVGPALHPVDDLSLLTPLNRGLLDPRSRLCRRLCSRRRSTAGSGSAALRVWPEFDIVRRRRSRCRRYRSDGRRNRRRHRAAPSQHRVHARFTAIANLTGLPAVSSLCIERDGLPIGVQSDRPAGRRRPLLRLARRSRPRGHGPTGVRRSPRHRVWR